jgi:hypothetical protein
MAYKKNQHYVPQFYFKNFNNGKVFISSYIVKKNIIIPSCSVADQASKDYFYGDSNAEDQVCLIENRLQHCLQDVVSNAGISKTALAHLTEYILFQDARTAKKRTETATAYRAMEALFSLSKNAKTIDDAKQWRIDNPLSGFSADDKQWHWRSILQAVSSAWSMQDLSYILLRNRTNLPFIFSDSPVIFMNPHMSAFSDRGTLGSISKGLIVVFPLNHENCILLYDTDVYNLKLIYLKSYDKAKRVLDITEVDTEVINSLQFFGAENCVYSGDQAALEKLKVLNRSTIRPEYLCAVDDVTDTKDMYTLKFHGTLQGVIEFPDLPFFDYKKSKRYVAGRPVPFKEHKKRVAKRTAMLQDKNFLRKLDGLTVDEIMSATRL